MPSQATNNPTSAGEQKVDDNELLLRYLKQIGSEESYPRLAEQGITSMASLRDMSAAMETREELAKALNMNVNNVTAEIVAGGIAVRFTINPAGLDPNAIKAALG